MHRRLATGDGRTVTDESKRRAKRSGRPDYAVRSVADHHAIRVAIGLALCAVVVAACAGGCRAREVQDAIQADPMLASDLGISGLASGELTRLVDPMGGRRVSVSRRHSGTTDIDAVRAEVQRRADGTGWDDVIVRCARTGTMLLMAHREIDGLDASLMVSLMERDGVLTVGVEISAQLEGAGSRSSPSLPNSCA